MNPELVSPGSLATRADPPALIERLACEPLFRGIGRAALQQLVQSAVWR